LTSENVGREEKLMPQRRKPPWTAASIAAFRSVIKYGINDSLSLPIGERTKAVILTAVQGLRLRSSFWQQWFTSKLHQHHSENSENLSKSATKDY
jgi:hypothetical protein